MARRSEGGEFFMRKSAFAIAVIAAACSSVAFAGEVKQGKKATAPATQMTNSEMDKVTAGAGIGHAYAFGKEDGKGWQFNNGIGKALGHLK
jgi:opacity protein-like surface antigen